MPGRRRTYQMNEDRIQRMEWILLFIVLVFLIPSMKIDWKGI